MDSEKTYSIGYIWYYDGQMYTSVCWFYHVIVLDNIAILIAFAIDILNDVRKIALDTWN